MCLNTHCIHTIIYTYDIIIIVTTTKMMMMTMVMNSNNNDDACVWVCAFTRQVRIQTFPFAKEHVWWQSTHHMSMRDWWHRSKWCSSHTIILLYVQIHAICYLLSISIVRYVPDWVANRQHRASSEPRWALALHVAGHLLHWSSFPSVTGLMATQFGPRQALLLWLSWIKINIYII